MNDYSKSVINILKLTGFHFNVFRIGTAIIQNCREYRFITNKTGV